MAINFLKESGLFQPPPRIRDAVLDVVLSEYTKYYIKENSLPKDMGDLGKLNIPAEMVQVLESLIGHSEGKILKSGAAEPLYEIELRVPNIHEDKDRTPVGRFEIILVAEDRDQTYTCYLFKNFARKAASGEIQPPPDRRVSVATVDEASLLIKTYLEMVALYMEDVERQLYKDNKNLEKAKSYVRSTTPTNQIDLDFDSWPYLKAEDKPYLDKVFSSYGTTHLDLLVHKNKKSRKGGHYRLFNKTFPNPEIKIVLDQYIMGLHFEKAVSELSIFVDHEVTHLGQNILKLVDLARKGEVKLKFTKGDDLHLGLPNPKSPSSKIRLNPEESYYNEPVEFFP